MYKLRTKIQAIDLPKQLTLKVYKELKKVRGPQIKYPIKIRKFENNRQILEEEIQRPINT